MTRLDAIKAREQQGRITPRSDVRWLLAQVESLAGALADQGTRSVDDPTDWCCFGHAGVFDGGPDSGHLPACRRARAALAALEAPDA